MSREEAPPLDEEALKLMRQLLETGWGSDVKLDKLRTEVIRRELEELDMDEPLEDFVVIRREDMDEPLEDFVVVRWTR